MFGRKAGPAGAFAESVACKLPPIVTNAANEPPSGWSGGSMAIALHFSFREHWQELKRGRPGRRFQDRYDRARSEESRGGPIKRIALIGLAIVCLAIGVVLAVMPGPAVLFFFLAGGLLATESRIVARLMDWLEVRLRKIIA